MKYIIVYFPHVDMFYCDNKQTIAQKDQTIVYILLRFNKKSQMVVGRIRQKYMGGYESTSGEGERRIGKDRPQFVYVLVLT